jgi:Lrp/AsnC family transcriptional regulator for asnA, asnC and gidA
MSYREDCTLDKLDISILKRLTADGRRRFTEIAEELDVSHGTIRNRFQRMQEVNALKIACWLDPQRVGFHAGAHIRFSVENPHLAEASATICAFPEVTWLGETMGGFNLMADVFCQDIQHLKWFVSRDLRTVPGVTYLEVGVYAHIHKVTTLPSLDLLDCAPRSTGNEGGPDVFRQNLGLRLLTPASSNSPLDELDIAILEHLSVDGRRPFTEIAEALGVSHGTIRNRYLRMLEANVVKVMCWLEPDQVGFHAVAHVDFSLELSHLEKAAARIASFPEVAWLASVIGQFNLMADIFCVDLDCLDALLSKRLSKIAGLRHMEVTLYTQIQKVTTMPNLELLKRRIADG